MFGIAYLFVVLILFMICSKCMMIVLLVAIVIITTVIWLFYDQLWFNTTFLEAQCPQ